MKTHFLEHQDKTLIHHYEEWIKVKEEDADWVIYHLIVKEPSISVEGLVTASGLDPCIVDASLNRLERYLLIERTEGKLRVLNVGEALLRCQIKYSQDLPYTIENGVIKERKT